MKQLFILFFCIAVVYPVFGMRSSDVAKKYGSEIAALQGVLTQFKQIQAMIFVPQATAFNRDMHAHVAFATGQLRATTQAFTFLSRADDYIQRRDACCLELYNRFLRLDEQQADGSWMRKSYSLPELIALLKRAIDEQDAFLLARVRFGGRSRAQSPLPVVQEHEIKPLAARQPVAMKRDVRCTLSAIMHVNIPGKSGVDCGVNTNTAALCVPEGHSNWFCVCATAVGVAIAAVFWSHSRVQHGAPAPVRDMSVDNCWLPLLY